MNEIMFQWYITYRGPIEEVGQNRSLKRTIWVSEGKDVKDPRSVSFDLFNDRVNLYPESMYKIWDKVNCSIKTRYRIYKDKNWVEKAYNSLNLRKMEMIQEWFNHSIPSDTWGEIESKLEQTKKQIEDGDLPF